MNYEELVEELNFETDNEERQKEARSLKKKLKSCFYYSIYYFND